MEWIFAVIFLFLGIQQTEATCTIPLSSGVWKTNSQGTWTIPTNRQQIQNFRVKYSKNKAAVALTMTCMDNTTDTDGYVYLQSDQLVPVLNGVNLNVHVCIKFEQQSSTNEDAYFFYLGSDLVVDFISGKIDVYERITVGGFDLATHCVSKSTAGERTNIAIKKDTETAAAVECPSSLIGTFTYSDTPTCTSTHLDVCTTRSEYNYNYTVCAEQQMFSANGLLQCVHSTTSGSYNYVTLYNRDSSVDSSTTFEFTCMKYTTSGSTVTSSIQPGQCYDDIYQTASSSQHAKGLSKTFINYGSSSCYTTTPEEASEFPWIYIVIAVAIILLILLLILIIYCCIKRKRKQRQQDEESIAPSEDEGVVEDHQSVIDDKEKEEDQQQELEKDDAIIIQETEKEKEKQKEKERRNSIDSGIQQDDKKMDGPGDKEEKKDGDPDDDQTKVLTKGKILDKEEKKDNDNKESAHDIKNKNEDGNVKTVIVQSTEENRDDEERESNSGKKTDNKGDDEKGNDTRTDIKEEVQEGQRSDSERNIRKNEDNDSGTESDDDIDKESEHSIGERKSNVQTSDNVSQKSLKVTNKNVVESQSDNVKDDNTVEDSNKDKESDTTHEKQVINTKEKVKKGRDSPEDTKGRQSPEDTKRQHSPNTKHVMEHENKKKENNNDIKQDISHQHESSETKQIKRIEVKEQEKDKEKDGSDNNDSEKEEEEEKEDDHSDRSGSRCSSRGSKSSDRSEIERNIHKVGMKKRTQYQPQGELSKVLVSREMEEKQRMSKEKGKWKKMKQLFRGKSKKVKDANQQHEDDDRDTQDLFDDEFSNGRNVAPFLKEYQYKKTMDHRFEEEEEEEMERQRRKRDKNGDMYTDSDDEDFEGIFTDSDDDYENEKTNEGEMNDENRRRKDENGQEMLTDDEKKRRQRDENGKEILTEEERKRRQRDENGKEILTEEERKRQSKYNKSKHDKDKSGTDEADELKRKRKSDENAKDSGVDSPDLKKEHSDINGFSENEDFNDFEMIDLPEGYIRDSSGQIVRLEDGKIIEEEELKSIFRLARLGVIFHVPRLKRTSNGRPTGGYIEDPFGPKKEKGRLSIGDGKIDHSKPKHPRSSRASSRKGHRDLYQQKSVAFDMNDDLSDISVHDEGSDRLNENDPTFENRELLKKRLFRNRRRRGLDNRMYQSEDGLPRELNELVRVIPQGQGPRSHMVPLPGTVLTRNDSYRNRFDPEQQQMYRDGLATDRRILEQSPSMQRRPGAPREAFMNGHVTDDMTERMQNEENEERQRRQDGNGVNIGSDDEFFLVGGRQERPEPFFTHVRRHPWQSNGNTSGMMHSVSHDGFCIPHDMRHTMPWSLYVRNPVRESSISDINLNMSRRQVGPKSADNSKRELDDKRLKELLEELYTDKKYFDHVIDTTDPNNEESIIDERHLATHGRDFLLERAEYWDERGVRIPRPPMTALGLRLSRQLTTVPDSGRVSNISYATTATPQPHPFQASNSQELDTPHAFVNQPDHSVC